MAGAGTAAVWEEERHRGLEAQDGWSRWTQGCGGEGRAESYYRLVHSDAEMEEVLSTNKEEKRTEEIWGEENIINSIY